MAAQAILSLNDPAALPLISTGSLLAVMMPTNITASGAILALSRGYTYRPVER